MFYHEILTIRLLLVTLTFRQPQASTVCLNAALYFEISTNR